MYKYTHLHKSICVYICIHMYTYSIQTSSLHHCSSANGRVSWLAVENRCCMHVFKFVCVCVCDCACACTCVCMLVRLRHHVCVRHILSICV